MISKEEFKINLYVKIIKTDTMRGETNKLGDPEGAPAMAGRSEGRQREPLSRLLALNDISKM